MLSQFEVETFTKEQSEDEIFVRDRGKTYRIPVEQLDNTEYGAFLYDVCVFAQLCAEIYHDKKDLKQQQKTAQCNYGGSVIDWLDRVKADGWEKLDWEMPVVKPGYNIKTLKYEIWVDRARKRAVVVFRGTAKLIDWWSNLNWLTRMVPFVNNHYKQVISLVEPTLKFIEDELGPGFQLYTTGHSLGGGLAQSFAYASNHKAVLVAAFHSSPVTGWFSITREKRKTAGDNLNIVRAYEHKEVLTGFRNLAKRFYPYTAQNPRISEFRTNFMVGGGAVSQHSVGCFANSYFAKLRKLRGGMFKRS